MNMRPEDVVDFIMKNMRRETFATHSFLFDLESRGIYEELIQKLSEQGFKMINVNECGDINSDDFNMSIADAGIIDESGKYRISDIVDDEQKKNVITSTKLNRLRDTIDANTLLLVSYNDLFRQNKVLYNKIRNWLKDGYHFQGTRVNIPLHAFVLLETHEDIRDFCPYGISVTE